MKQNTHTLTDEQLTKLLANDPDTVAFVRNLVEPPRVKKWEELGRIEGYVIDEFCRVVNVKQVTTHHMTEATYNTEPQAIGYGIAAAKLTQVVKDARQGWVPKWDGSQENWCVYKVYGKFMVELLKEIETPFALPTRELAEQLLETCREDLEAFYAAVGS